MKPKIIFIHPPVSKPAEPPAGVAKLAGSLTAKGIAYEVIDANLEGMLFLLKSETSKDKAADRWTMRARRHLENNVSALRASGIYQNQSRYRRAVSDINRLLGSAGKDYGVALSLSDYHDRLLTPVKSHDLFSAAGNPEQNLFYHYFSARLENALQENPDFIGFSLNYLSQALCTFAMIGFLKKNNPRQKIILGGSLATSWTKITGGSNIFSGLVDEIVAGRGEEKLLELLGKKDCSWNFAPAYGNFPLTDYLSPGLVLPYSTAHGCYWHSCSFCPEKAEDNPYLPQPANQVLTQLQSLRDELHPGLIHLLDNALSPALLRALADSSLGIPWYGFTRITSHLTDEDFCRSLKKSGCVMLKLGIESGDQKVLDKLHKGIELTIVSRVLQTLKKAGIATYVYLLFGTPPEDEESAVKTLNFTVGHSDCIDFLNLAIFNLPVASEEAKSLATADFYEGDLSLYKDFAHPASWQRADVRRFLEKTFKKHPAAAAIIERTPPYFTSNHAPFFVLNKTC
ncbi:MAG: Radical SAM superfamily protein [Smithella sp. PtaU1.Bin162]|nr:MAG: Radical SAM superfamily protein [Smithella sp. PtaU1.Bin162]